MSGHSNHNHSHHAEKTRVAKISALASFGLSIAKFAAAIMTGSLGMLSEAIHSLVDMGATLITWAAISLSAKPADDDHHFGHAKIESIAALFESGLLLGTALFIAYEAIQRLRSGDYSIEIAWWAFAILLLSMLIDFNRSSALRRTAAATNSIALAADAKHFEADMWSSLAALIGLCGVWLGWPWMDAIAALIVSAFIARIAWGLGKETLSGLLDRAPEGSSEEIRKLAGAIDGILDTHQIRIRAVGSTLFISLIVDVSRLMPLTNIASLKEKLVDAIQHKFPNADVTITTNPVALDNETAADKIMLIAHQRGHAIHHLTVQQIEGKLAVSFDLEVEGATSLKVAHAQATALETAIRNSLGADVEVESHIEPRPIQLIEGKPATEKRSKQVEAELRNAAKLEKQLSDLHSIRIRETASGLFIHYHCRFAASTTIDNVHAAVDRIENALQKKRPEIRRIVAHAEPIGQARHKL
jgi:cation diffusion facilitator family transporter